MPRATALLTMSAACTLLAACATPVAPLDNSPQNQTAYIEEYTHNFGFKGFFANEATQQEYVRDTMRREDSEMKMTGAVARWFIKPAPEAHIARIDRNLQWDIDKDKKVYTECPLGGCRAKHAPAKPQSQPEPERQQGEAPGLQKGCKLAVTKNSLEVKRTGQKRAVNGFESEEYRLRWLIEMADAHKRKTKNTFTIDLWTTTPNEEMTRVFNIQKTFQRNYAAKVARNHGTTPGVVPQEALTIIAQYFQTALSPKDRAKLLHYSKELAKIKGYPVSTRFEWYVEGNACAAPEAQAPEKKRESNTMPTSMGGLMSSLAGGLMEKKSEQMAKDAEGKPVFAFVHEVRAMKLQPMHDSLFVPPVGYKLDDRR